MSAFDMHFDTVTRSSIVQKSVTIEVGAFVESHVLEPVLLFLYTINPIYSFTKNVFTYIQM
jgi:hypothetical protein